MFFAFAFLFPDTTVLLFFILPVKMKWLAYLDGALFAFDIIKAIGAHNWAGVVLPIVALLNFAVFIWPEVHYLANRTRQQYSPRTVQFKQAVKQQEKEKAITTSAPCAAEPTPTTPICSSAIAASARATTASVRITSSTTYTSPRSECKAPSGLLAGWRFFVYSRSAAPLTMW